MKMVRIMLSILASLTIILLMVQAVCAQPSQEIEIQEQAGDTDHNYIDICMERNGHLAKARELFPNDKNIDKYWEMYRQQYMTEEERILIPDRISTNHPCHTEGKLIVPVPRP